MRLDLRRIAVAALLLCAALAPAAQTLGQRAASKRQAPKQSATGEARAASSVESRLSRLHALLEELWHTTCARAPSSHPYSATSVTTTA
jgi:hypothetical protein